MNEKEISQYLPLSEATYFILASTREPIHGYRIMQRVDALSQGHVRVGAGTLYGVLSSLERDKLIQMIAEEDRRKIYQITSYGRLVLEKQKQRYEIMVSAYDFKDADWRIK